MSNTPVKLQLKTSSIDQYTHFHPWSAFITGTRESVRTMDYWFRVGLIHPLAYESKQKHLKTTFSEFQGSRKPLGRSQKAHKAIMASSWYDTFMVSQIELTRFYSLTVYLSESEWNLLLGLDPLQMDLLLVNIPVSVNYEAEVLFHWILLFNTEKAKFYSKKKKRRNVKRSD